MWYAIKSMAKVLSIRLFPMTPAKSINSPIIIKNDSGYRYSLEPFLLADFARLFSNQEVLDIGTGCGIIPLLMAFREPELKITGIEIQDSAAEEAMAKVSRIRRASNRGGGGYVGGESGARGLGSSSV